MDPDDPRGLAAKYRLNTWSCVTRFVLIVGAIAAIATVIGVAVLASKGAVIVTEARTAIAALERATDPSHLAALMENAFPEDKIAAVAEASCSDERLKRVVGEVVDERMGAFLRPKKP